MGRSRQPCCPHPAHRAAPNGVGRSSSRSSSGWLLALAALALALRWLLLVTYDGSEGHG